MPDAFQSQQLSECSASFELGQDQAQDSLHDQGISLHSHIAESSHAAYDFLLLNIEWSVWWFVVQPPSQAVQFMFGLLKTVPMDVGLTAAFPSSRDRVFFRMLVLVLAALFLEL